MKKYSRILIIVNLLILLGYFNWTVYQKEQTLKNGTFLLMRLAPVDPRSLMQGDYMNLNYEEASSELVNDSTPKQGYAILTVNNHHVGKIIRLQNTMPSLVSGEIVLKYKISKYNQLLLGAHSFFFEEGQSSNYENAVYGGLRVDTDGESVLIGLYNKGFQLLKGQ